MEFLGFILLLVGGGLFYTWHYKQDKLRNKKTGELPSKKSVYWTGGILIFFGLGLMGSKSEEGTVPASVASPTNQIAAQTLPSVAADKAQEVEPTKVESNELTLDLTPEEFRQKFNAQIRQADVSYLRPVAEFDIETGEINDAFKVYFSKGVGMIGSVNKNGKLNSITFIMTKADEGLAEPASLMLLSAFAARAFNPEFPAKETANAVAQLLGDAAENVDEKENLHKKIFGKVQYVATAGKYIGLWMIFEPNK